MRPVKREPARRGDEAAMKKSQAMKLKTFYEAFLRGIPCDDKELFTHRCNQACSVNVLIRKGLVKQFTLGGKKPLARLIDRRAKIFQYEAGM